MKTLGSLLIVLFVGLVPGISVVAADEKRPDVAKRYVVKKDYLGGGLQVAFEQDEIGLKADKAGATVSTLTFSEPCELKIIKKDKTLIASKEGLVAKDDQGKTWKSRKVKLGDKDVNAFFAED